MPNEIEGRPRGRFAHWWHETFDDWLFRSFVGPAQATPGAIQGSDETARQQWKRDLAARKRYSREQRELHRLARERARDN